MSDVQQELCRVCDRPRVVEEYGTYCSEFCAVVQKSDAEQFLEAKHSEGWWGVWPCAECGCPTEGEYAKDAICYECAPKRRMRALEALLDETLGHLSEPAAAELVQKIKKLLRR